MWKTITRRILIMIPQVIILSILIFALSKAMPGDVYSSQIGPGIDPQRIAELREKAGLNKPVYQQYGIWAKNALKGEFGYSVVQKSDVTTLIKDRAKNTIALSLLTIIIMYLIAIPLGILSGKYSNSLLDRIVNVYNFICIAIPNFVLYLIVLLFFAYELKWFPTGGTISMDAQNSGFIPVFLSKMHHMLLPALSSAVLGTVGTIQYLRNEIIDAKNQDYVRTARSKGVPEKLVYRKHILRNSLLPIAAFSGFQITGLIGGSMMIEQIFSYPGMGQLFYQSIMSRDNPTATAVLLLMGLLTLIGSLISDIALSIVDPRIRIE